MKYTVGFIMLLTTQTVTTLKAKNIAQVLPFCHEK